MVGSNAHAAPFQELGQCVRERLEVGNIHERHVTRYNVESSLLSNKHMVSR